MKLWFIVFFLVTSTVSGRTHGHSSRHGGSHSYPHSTGYSGYGSGGSHTYPHSTGLSGNSNSGNVRQTYTQQHTVNHNSYSARTEVHHHYHYSPPQQISYGSTYHPVYQGHPPIYVYEYRDSGSRFDNLLTGLALYNLGRSSQMHHHYEADRQYSGSPGEICKLGISKQTGEYEETRINCNLISSFILEDASSSSWNNQQQQHIVKNTTQVTQTVNGTGNSSVTTVTVTSNTVEDALKVKGPSIAVTPGMTCYMIRIFRDTTSFRKPVDCGLLQEYARSSLHRNSELRLEPCIVTLLFNFLIAYLVRCN
ncbi:unnamed protein product [Spodoptera exigua]|uniref:Uncharacterized protein n=1 Tax=Spodoptera exigua TaxID=7107 RepID=A0A922MCA3_SPOEX|nr:hypothetical protein HF086_002914 [Spodoptera exigua]CAH0694525.1 unnamed protein product [Spodoptera exigua]